jgi:predicted ferric reductase
MAPYKVSLKAHKKLCAGTSAFYFAKPEGFEFEAGQFVNFTLLGPGDTDLEGNTRALSIASAPHERNLMVAMRLRTTAFQRTLNSLPPQAELLLQGPYGSLTLSRNGTRPAVFLAGGMASHLSAASFGTQPNRCPPAEFSFSIPYVSPRKRHSSKSCGKWSNTTGATNSSARSHNPRKWQRLGTARRAEFRSQCYPSGFRI